MHRLDVHVISLEVDRDTVVVGLQNRFGLPRSTAERFLQELPRVARYQVDHDEANAYKRVLTELGVRVVLRPSTSSIPEDNVPSLPVPAHGPTGITRSMRAYASSARLANRVPRAPALPEDLTGPQVLEFVDSDSDAPPEVSDSWLADQSFGPDLEFMDASAQLSSQPGDGSGGRHLRPANDVGPHGGPEPRSDTPTRRASASHIAMRKRRVGLALVGVATLLGLAAALLFQLGPF